MSEEIKQISEDQASEMAETIIELPLTEIAVPWIEATKFLITEWRKAGFIEKSELEIAAELYENTYNINQIVPVIANYIDLLKSELEKKNKEIQELKK